MRNFVVVLVVFFIVQVAASQIRTEPKHIISAGAGYTSQFFIDHHASPLRYQDTAVPVSVQYVRNTARGHHRIVFGYNTGTFTPSSVRQERMFEEYFRIQVQGGYVHHIASLFDDRVRFFGGFYFDNFFTHRDHYYFQNRNEIFAEYITSFHPSIEAYYMIGKGGEVRTRMAASAVALIYHSPYSVRGPIQGTFQFFDSYRQMEALLSYRHLITSRIQIEMTYTFNYYRHETPQDFKSARDQIMVLFGYRI